MNMKHLIVLGSLVAVALVVFPTASATASCEYRDEDLGLVRVTNTNCTDDSGAIPRVYGGGGIFVAGHESLYVYWL